jgi:hypothetical protein
MHPFGLDPDSAVAQGSILKKQFTGSIGMKLMIYAFHSDSFILRITIVRIGFGRVGLKSALFGEAVLFASKTIGAKPGEDPEDFASNWAGANPTRREARGANKHSMPCALRSSRASFQIDPAAKSLIDAEIAPFPPDPLPASAHAHARPLRLLLRNSWPGRPVSHWLFSNERFMHRNC